MICFGDQRQAGFQQNPVMEVIRKLHGQWTGGWHDLCSMFKDYDFDWINATIAIPMSRPFGPGSRIRTIQYILAETILNGATVTNGSEW